MWRNTGLPVRLFMLDARACLPILCVTVYWSWVTLEIAIVGVAFFGTISFLGLTLPAMLRLLRRVVVGPVRTAVPVWNRRRLA
jgi:intracellular multiplication protein IcmT